MGARIAGRWSLEELIGAGGSAEVYAARDELGGSAAVKVLYADLACSVDARRRFLSELALSKRIEHPARTRIFEADFMVSGAPALIMERLHGETLHARLRRERQLPVLEALRIVDGVLDFLVACHDAQIVHRDLKPANVFLCHDGTLKILDFGAARDRSPSSGPSSTRGAVGTPSWMPPEQAAGESEEHDDRSDIYAVGAILFALITGEEPKTDEAQRAVGSGPRICPSIATIVTEMPDDVVRLVDRATAWHRQGRWRNAKRMQEEVREIACRYAGRVNWIAGRHSQVAGELDDIPTRPSRPKLPRTRIER